MSILRCGLLPRFCIWSTSSCLLPHLLPLHSAQVFPYFALRYGSATVSRQYSYSIVRFPFFLIAFRGLCLKQYSEYALLPQTIQDIDILFSPFALISYGVDGNRCITVRSSLAPYSLACLVCLSRYIDVTEPSYGAILAATACVLSLTAQILFLKLLRC